MTREASTPLREALHAVATAETEVEVEEAMDAMQTVLEAETAQREAYEREQRSRSGTVRVVTPKQQQAAIDEFNTAREQALGLDGSGPR